MDNMMTCGHGNMFQDIHHLLPKGIVYGNIDRHFRQELKFKAHRGEFFALILISTVGMMLLSSARELIFLYVSLELVTIPLYVLAAYMKPDSKSAEAGLKYMLLGAISSAVLLYGISLIYGVTGTTFLSEIKTKLMVDYLKTGFIGPGLFLSFIFFIAGFGFKLALVPFHMWAPDVYEGAPTPITAFLSVGSKAAGVPQCARNNVTGRK